MHRLLVDKEEYRLAWLNGSDCLLASARDELIGFRTVSTFFSEIREFRAASGAHALVLDIRPMAKLPDELWAWVGRCWYTQMIELGLKRQAVVAPLNLSAKMQWRGLAVPRLASKNFTKVSKAIHWISSDSAEHRPNLRRMELLPA
ncbi:MAG: hypothetical protein QNJ40_18155 [Xanthomonadales bacterium]|nr:hypothetical protein [Xanthomonadales bacterium]